jgi:hypothetical protein
MPKKRAFAGRARGTARAKRLRVVGVLNLNLNAESEEIMKKSFIASLAFAAISLSAGLASASEYICLAAYIPGPGFGGSYGYFTTSVYTGPDCTGSLVGYYSFCSGNTPVSFCAQSQEYRAQSYEQMAIWATKAIDAAQWNLPVNIGVVTCASGGGVNCGGYIQFY